MGSVSKLVDVAEESKVVRRDKARARYAAVAASDGDMVEAWAELEGSRWKRDTMAESVSGMLDALASSTPPGPL